MSNAVETAGGGQRKLLLIALAGIFIFWLCALAGTYIGVVQDVNGSAHNQVSGSTYIWLLGIIALGAGAVYAKRAGRSLAGGRLNHSVAVFAQVLVIVTLVTGTIYGFVVFVGNAFNRAMSGSGVDQNELMRVVNVYLPIILAAGLLVAVIILAFVHTSNTDDEDPNHA